MGDWFIEQIQRAKQEVAKWPESLRECFKDEPEIDLTRNPHHE